MSPKGMRGVYLESIFCFEGVGQRHCSKATKERRQRAIEFEHSTIAVPPPLTLCVLR